MKSTVNVYITCMKIGKAQGRLQSKIIQLTNTKLNWQTYSYFLAQKNLVIRQPRHWQGLTTLVRKTCISSCKYSCNFRLLTTHNRCIILILVRGNEWLYFGVLIGILLTICLLLLPSRSVFLCSQFLSVYQFGYAGLREKQRWPRYDSVDDSDVADRYIWSWFWHICAHDCVRFIHSRC